jgi:hypothetical protein
MIFGREPATIAAAVKAIVAVIALTLVTMTDTQQAAVNATVAFVLAVIVAVTVRQEKIFAFLVGAVETGFYLAGEFGFHWSADKQAAVLVLVGAVVAVITRDRVVAPIGPNGERVA